MNKNIKFFNFIFFLKKSLPTKQGFIGKLKLIEKMKF
jgi:hypothetical protein